jgi:hypothetical protein
MGRDAVGIAGNVFGLGRVIRRSAAAAGQAVVSELEALQPTPTQEPEPAPEPESPSVEVEPPPAPPPEPAAPPARSALVLDDDQRAVLESATSAVVAVNRECHPPQLTMASVLWDGETLRFATLGWSRRSTMLRADPRIGVLVESPDGHYVTVTGLSRIREGRDARDAMWPILLRDAGDEGEVGAEARWQALLASDPDRAVIVIDLEQVLSGRR